MFSRVRWLGIACLVGLLSPAICRAAEPQGASRGRGGVGGQIGGSYLVATQDYSKGALPRFDFAGHFRYVLAGWFRMQVSPGFTWSGYSKEEPPPFTDFRFPTDQTKEHYLTLLIPVSVQGQLTWDLGPWHWHLGAGPGIYRVLVENHRKTLEDPVTFRPHRGPYLGGSAELGAERFFKILPSTSVEFSIVGHHVTATRDDQFPTGWNSNLRAAAVRVGATYYFDLKRVKKAPELPLPGTGK
ncbi:MAG TPA: hypothetical protein VGK93_00045 [Candidatus Eisenbacteria bacterium]|jgi:hypothetical protein